MYEITHTVEAMIICPSCGYLCELEDYIINFGWCNNCFDESYTQYLEEHAGPFDWIVRPF